MSSQLAQQTKNIQNYIKLNPIIENIKEIEIAEIYQQLIDCLTDHNHLYYIENQPIIGDGEYDALFSYLKKIEEYFPHIISNNSPTQQLVGQIAEEFTQANHKIKLLSLENTYNAEDILERQKRIEKELEKQTSKNNLYPTFVITPKFDGLSVELIYKNKKLRKAITRGDGNVGEDITENVKMISNIPQNLESSLREKYEISELSVRGEILMPIPQRKTLNTEREKKGETPFANTRNAASGSIKLLDANEVKKRGLTCFVYDIIYCTSQKNLGDTHEKIISHTTKLGLPTFERIQYKKTITETISLCSQQTQELLHSFPYDFDGLVIKINEIPLRQKLGDTAHHPRRQIAYKFPATQAKTKIISVEFQVSRTGTITPVAHLDPVQLSGVTISRVSLHNFDFIAKKDIQINDYIRIQRSGEVIPYVTSVMKELRLQTTPITAPTHCPICDHLTTQADIYLFCTNFSCPAQIKEKIIHFASKECMNIEGIGKSTIELCVDQGLLKNITDLYELSTDQRKIQLRSLPGFGDKKLYELQKQIENSKSQPLRRILNAIGIPGIGKKMAQELHSAILKTAAENNRIKENSIDEITKLFTDTTFLQQIYGIGEKLIISIQDFRKNNIKLLTTLAKFGVNFSRTKHQNTSVTDHIRKDKHICITGTFPTSRDTITKLLGSIGAHIDSQPTQKTDIILIGEDAGKKAEKAKKLSITIYQNRDKIISFLPELIHSQKQKTESPQIIAPSLF